MSSSTLLQPEVMMTVYAAAMRLVDGPISQGAFHYARLVSAELASLSGEGEVVRCRRTVERWDDGDGYGDEEEEEDRYLSKRHLLALLEYGALHLLGTPAEECRAFLGAAAACLREPPGRPGAGQVTVDPARATALGAQHRERAERIFRALDEDVLDDLHHRCFLLQSHVRRRDRGDVPQIDRECLHIGVMASPPAGLHLCCHHEHIEVLPLFYLLREELRAHPRMAGYAVDVLPPDLEQILAEEKRIVAAAAEVDGWEGAAEELSWLPASFQTSVGKLRQWLIGRVAAGLAEYSELPEKQPEAGAGALARAAALLTREVQRRVSAYRRDTVLSIAYALAEGDTTRVDWREAEGKATGPERDLKRHFYMQLLRRRSRHQWWRVHRLPDDAEGKTRQLATLTFTLGHSPPCSATLCFETEAAVHSTLDSVQPPH